MANKKQSPMKTILIVAIVVVVAFFIVRAIRPPALPDYFVCVAEGCLFRISGRELRVAQLGECPDCGGRPLVPERILPQ